MASCWRCRVDLKPCVGVWRPEEYESYTSRALAELPPLSPRLTELERFFYGSSHDTELDAAGRIMVPNSLRRARHAVQGGRRGGRGGPSGAVGQGRMGGHRSTLLSGVAEVTARVDDAA